MRTCLLVPPSSNTAFVSLRGHRKPVLFVGFFSGWAVFALQLGYLWQIATCSWQQTFTLSSGGVARQCFAHLWWEIRRNLPVCITAAMLKPVPQQSYERVLRSTHGPKRCALYRAQGAHTCVCVCVQEQGLCCLTWTLALSSWQSDVLC